MIRLFQNVMLGLRMSQKQLNVILIYRKYFSWTGGISMRALSLSTAGQMSSLL